MRPPQHRRHGHPAAPQMVRQGVFGTQLPGGADQRVVPLDERLSAVRNRGRGALRGGQAGPVTGTR